MTDRIKPQVPAAALPHRNLESLLRSMAPWESIIDQCCSENWTTTLTAKVEEDKRQPTDAIQPWFSYDGQESFARQTQYVWDDEEYGPSKRYLRSVISKYIAKLEQQDDAEIESDALAMLVVTASARGASPPEPDEHCHVSFDILSYIDGKHIWPKNRDGLLRIRVYPYHNDVALRLWEAGAHLAEYFVANKQRIWGRKVIELGAGVGCTGLVLAGCCGADSVYLTDYTEACRYNLEHNIDLNREWVDNMRKLTDAPKDVEVFQGYLEWESFSEKDILSASEEYESARYFMEAELLIAADVVYDITVVESLVIVIREFLRAPMQSERQRQVILAVTKRNISSFELLLGHLDSHGIVYEWIMGSNDWESLPSIFPIKFNQPRSDVSIAELTLGKS